MACGQSGGGGRGRRGGRRTVAEAVCKSRTKGEEQPGIKKEGGKSVCVCCAPGGKKWLL